MTKMGVTTNDTTDTPCLLCGHELPKQVLVCVLEHCVFPAAYLIQSSCTSMLDLVRAAPPEIGYLQVPRDFESVQEAVNRAPSPGCVMLAAGVHELQLEHLQLRPGVKLIGQGAALTVLTYKRARREQEQKQEQFAVARALITNLQQNCYWLEVPNGLHKATHIDILRFFDSDGAMLPETCAAAEAETSEDVDCELVLQASTPGSLESVVSGLALRGRVEVHSGGHIALDHCTITANWGGGVVVAEPHSRSVLKHCTIGSSEGNCIQVSAGATAILEDCAVKEHPNKHNGIFVNDSGSQITLRRCQIAWRTSAAPFERWGHHEYGVACASSGYAVLEECKVRDGVHMEQSGSRVTLRSCSIAGVGSDVSGSFEVPQGQQEFNLESDSRGLDFRCTFDIKSRLLNFIKTKSPSQLSEASNLLSPKSASKSPRWFRGKPQPIPGQSPDLHLSRDDSLECLKELSRNKSHVTVEMTRTESLEALNLLVRDSSLDRELSLGHMPRTVSLEKLSSIDETKSPEHSSKKLNRVQSLHSGITQFRDSQQSPVASPKVPVQIVDRSPIPVDALQRMIGHKLPYAMQLAHELMLDDHFEFSVDGLILPDPNQRHIIRLFLQASAGQQQAALYTALSKIAEGDTSHQSEAVVGKTIHQIRDVLGSILNANVTDNDTFDVAFICQMLRQQAYGPEQLRQMVHFIFDSAVEGSGIESPAIVDWISRADQLIDAAAADGKLFAAASALLTQLLQQLKQLRTDEMNVRLNLFRPAFQRVGAEFERDQVAAAVKSGKLGLDKTTPWLDDAWQTLVPVPKQLSRAAVVATHRKAMQMLIKSLALRNKKHIKIKALPEVLALDANRITSVQAEVRRLSVGVALFTLSSGMLGAVGVQLSDPQKSNFQASVLEKLSTAKSASELCCEVGKLIKEAVGEESVGRLPDDEQLVKALWGASTNRKAGNLRELFTDRISVAVVAIGPLRTEKLHSSIMSVKDEINVVALDVDRLCSHLEMAYAQLYTALLASAQIEK